MVEVKLENGIAQAFVDACIDTRKAWHRTNLLAISKPATIARVRAALVDGSTESITDLLIEIMGPVAPVNPIDAMGSASMGHREMAKIICSLAVKGGLYFRQKKQTLDLELVKTYLVNWINTGDFDLTHHPKLVLLSAQSRQLADVFNSTKYPERVRLAIVAPIAPALESMIVMTLLSNTIVNLLIDTSDKASDLKLKADELIPDSYQLDSDEEDESYKECLSVREGLPKPNSIGSSTSPFGYMARFLNPSLAKMSQLIKSKG